MNFAGMLGFERAKLFTVRFKYRTLRNTTTIHVRFLTFGFTVQLYLFIYSFIYTYLFELKQQLKTISMQRSLILFALQPLLLIHVSGRVNNTRHLQTVWRSHHCLFSILFSFCRIKRFSEHQRDGIKYSKKKKKDIYRILGFYISLNRCSSCLLFQYIILNTTPTPTPTNNNHLNCIVIEKIYQSYISHL